MIEEVKLFDKLIKGTANIYDVQTLIKIYKNKYHLIKKESAFIELACYKELLRRLKLSVFNDNNITKYPVSKKKKPCFCRVLQHFAIYRANNKYHENS